MPFHAGTRQLLHAEWRAANPSHDVECARTERLQRPSHLPVKQRKKPQSDEVRCGRATAHRMMALVVAYFGRIKVAICVNSRLAHHRGFRMHREAGSCPWRRPAGFQEVFGGGGGELLPSETVRYVMSQMLLDICKSATRKTSTAKLRSGRPGYGEDYGIGAGLFTLGREVTPSKQSP